MRPIFRATGGSGHVGCAVAPDHVTTARRIGFEQRIVTNLHNLGRLRCERGELQQAKRLLDEALDIARKIDFRFGVALVLCQLGHTAAALNEPEASAHYAEALRIAREEKIERVAVETLRGMAAQMAATGDLERAVELLALAAHHAASDCETKRKARRRLSELKARLSPERFAVAVKRGKVSESVSVKRRKASRIG